MIGFGGSSPFIGSESSQDQTVTPDLQTDFKTLFDAIDFLLTIQGQEITAPAALEGITPCPTQLL
eukprot:766764-Hanusia_phi.AAC.4